MATSVRPFLDRRMSPSLMPRKNDPSRRPISSVAVRYWIGLADDEIADAVLGPAGFDHPDGDADDDEDGGRAVHEGLGEENGEPLHVS